MCIVFPIILFVIILLIVVSVYYSDVISIRSCLERNLIRNLEEDRDIKELKSKIDNELQGLVMISDINGLKLKEKSNEIEVSIETKLEIFLFDIRFNDVVSVNMYGMDNRDFIVKNKVIFDQLE